MSYLRNAFSIVLCLFSVQLFAQINDSTTLSVPDSLTIILEYSPAFDPYLKESGYRSIKTIRLSNAELKIVDSLTKAALDSNKQFAYFIHRGAYGQTTKEKVDINLENYYRQYVPFMSEKGERMVWVNCFDKRFLDNINDRERRKKSLLKVDGGGYGLFCFYVILSKRKFEEFRFNALD